MEATRKTQISETLVLAPKYNTPGKSDATGAFQLGAALFAVYHFGRTPEFHIPNPLVQYIDNKKAYITRGAQVALLLEKYEPRVFIVFCHGWQHGIQLGMCVPAIPSAGAIWERCVHVLAKHSNPIVVLYACSTGDHTIGAQNTAPGTGEGSFADHLRDALCTAGAPYCRVVAHTTAGHAYQNPDVRIFDGLGVADSQKGGIALWQKREAKLRRNFQKLLTIAPSDPRYGLAWEFPFMEIEDIRSYVQKDLYEASSL